MRIGNVDTSQKVLIVAEIGNNHEGNFETAQELVRKAAEAGVDAVKFQTFQTRYFTSGKDPARFKRLSSFELTHEQFSALERLARSLGIGFLSTPLDLESLRFLAPIVDALKIASGDNNFLALLRAACQTGKPLIISSGMTDLATIAATREYVRRQWASLGIKQDVAILHCVSSYPAPPEQLDLAAIPLLQEQLQGAVIGYSDHSIGEEACVVAVSLGSRILEKHFTLDKHFSEFRDHQLSADPAEMRSIVERVRVVERLLGRREKVVHDCEKEIEKIARRSIVAGADLPRGHRLATEDLTWIRPFDGLAPGREDELIGRALKRPVSFGQPILLTDVE